MSRELMNARSENGDDRTSMSSQFGPITRAVSVVNVSSVSAPRSGVHDDSDEKVSGEQSAPAAANAPKPDVGAERDGLRNYLYIQMQLCNKSFKEWLDDNNSLIAEASSPGSGVQMRNPRFVFTLFSQIVSAITYIHSQGYIHRDLKVSLWG